MLSLDGNISRNTEQPTRNRFDLIAHFTIFELKKYGKEQIIQDLAIYREIS